MKIIYQGQIGVVAGLNSEEREVTDGTTVASLISEIAAGMPQEVAKFLIDSDGKVNSSLFVAVDNDHVLDMNTPLKDARELLLMPPMAGG